MPVKKGDKVEVEYKGTLDDGTVFDKTSGCNDKNCDCEGECNCEKEGCEEEQGNCGCGCNTGPFKFEAGAGQVIEGFDKAVIGMEIGDETEVRIESADAYGDPNPEMIQQVPADQFPPEAGLEVGMMFLIETPDGNRLPAKVVNISEEAVAIDLNHPLAGKALNFWIKVTGLPEE